ncbi:cupin domain-containing protein [Pseudonocardia kujensis]|uniref:cupin domain-containing protein n=1 Tax=Pseudonocardia kujensis TaxID=1128675 RepID=UPI001E296B88|nr:cupin domain-containing protein [Pseudonocardia kujensis]MCE0765578.1 cupin domain-containing protein [Pseudonocardia kujensis]
MAVNSVTFLEGARTFWHTHEHGQLLLVTAGTGWVVNEDGDRQRVEQGDLVWSEPGERHWHGAVSASDLTHLAVSLGLTSWHDEAVDDPDRP